MANLESKQTDLEAQVSNPKWTVEVNFNPVESLKKIVGDTDEHAIVNINGGLVAEQDDSRFMAMLDALSNKKVRASIAGLSRWKPSADIKLRAESIRQKRAQELMQMKYDTSSIALTGKPYQDFKREMQEAMKKPTPSTAGLNNQPEPIFMQQVENYSTKDHLITTMAMASIGTIADAFTSGKTGANNVAIAGASALAQGMAYIDTNVHARKALQASIASKNFEIATKYNADRLEMLKEYDKSMNDIEKEYLKTQGDIYDRLMKKYELDITQQKNKNELVTKAHEAANKAFDLLDKAEIKTAELNNKGKIAELEQNAQTKRTNATNATSVAIANARQKLNAVRAMVSHYDAVNQGYMRATERQIQESVAKADAITNGRAGEFVNVAYTTPLSKEDITYLSPQSAELNAGLKKALEEGCDAHNYFDSSMTACVQKATTFTLQMLATGHRVSPSLLRNIDFESIDMDTITDITSNTWAIDGSGATAIKQRADVFKKAGIPMSESSFTPNIVESLVRTDWWGSLDKEERRAIINDPVRLHKEAVSHLSPSVIRNHKVSVLSARSFPLRLGNIYNKAEAVSKQIGDARDSVNDMIKEENKAKKGK